MLRHRVNTEIAQLTGLSGRNAGEKPGTPQNLTGNEEDAGANLRLTWDAPETGGPFFLYELYLDDAFLATTAGTEYLYTDIVYGTNYEFKVRCIGALGIRGDFSTPFNHIGGGLPTLNVKVTGHWLAASVRWDPIESNVDYTVEGYNVYRNQGGVYTKLNSTLIALDDDLEWFVEGVSGNTEVTLAVTFEYNTGLESVYFEDSDTTSSLPVGKWIARVVSNWAYLGNAEGGPIKQTWGPSVYGFRVKMGATVQILPLTIKKPQARQWASGTADSFINEYKLTGAVTGKYRWYIGCSPSTLTKTIQRPGGLIDYPITKLIQASRKRVTGPNFLVVGPTCDDSIAQEISYSIEVNLDDLVDFYYPPADYTGIVFHIAYKPPTNVSVSVTGSDATVTFNEYPGVQYNVFLREIGDTYSQHNSEPLDGSPYVIEGLAAGDYEVVVGYVYKAYETHPLDNPETDTFTIV